MNIFTDVKMEILTRGTDITEESSMNDVWKAVNKILKPKTGSRSMTIKTEHSKIDDPKKVAETLISGSRII